MPSIRNQCEDCGKFYHLDVKGLKEISCPHCRKKSWNLSQKGHEFASCIFCGFDKFYRQKAFNPLLGLGIIGIGACLVPWTYGLSLPALFLIDLWLHKRVKDSAVCYNCRAEYKAYHILENITIFNHKLAAGFEKISKINKGV